MLQSTSQNTNHTHGHSQVEEHEVVIVGHFSSLPLECNGRQVYLLQGHIGLGQDLFVEGVPLARRGEYKK